MEWNGLINYKGKLSIEFLESENLEKSYFNRSTLWVVDLQYKNIATARDNPQLQTDHPKQIKQL